MTLNIQTPIEVSKKRQPISKSIRFQVFKRDGFTCQYCGQTPPAVVLEVDHINPVANGGKNDIDNLATSCFDCNRGKSDGLLTDIPFLSMNELEHAMDKAASLISDPARAIKYFCGICWKKRKQGVN